MKTKLLPFAALALLASSAFAATPTYLYRLYSPGVKGAAAAPADSLTPTASSVFATWNPADKGTYVVLSNGNLTAGRNGTNGWTSVRATQGKSSGKWYWEITLTDLYGANYGFILGAGTSSFKLSNFTGGSGNSFGWYPGSNNYNLTWPGATVGANPTGGSYPVGTTFMVAIDLDNQAVYLGANGIWNGGGVPTSGAAKTGAAVVGVTGTVFPAVSPYQAQGTQSTSNFGATPFKYAVPTGYHAGVFQ